jgi:hypothetical protein
MTKAVRQFCRSHAALVLQQIVNLAIELQEMLSSPAQRRDVVSTKGG